MKPTLMILGACLLMLSAGNAHAQQVNTPTPTPSPTPVVGRQNPTPTPVVDNRNPTPTPVQAGGGPGGAPGGGQKPASPSAERVNNCDVCGYCEGMAKAPSDWQACRACVYPQFDGKAGSNGDVDPFSKITLIGPPETDIYHYYTSLGCISTQPGEFAQQIANVFFGIVGGLAFLTFLYGIGIVATSQGNPERLNYGKRMVYGAVAGLLFAIFSVGIIQFLTTGLGLPGFN